MPRGNRTATVTADEIDVPRLLSALTAFKKGDFSARLPGDWSGKAGKVADTFNDVAERMEQFTDDLLKVSRVVGKDGKIAERLALGGVSGSWNGQREAVNSLIAAWSRSSPGRMPPLGMDHAPSWRPVQYGPPGCPRSTSICSFRRRKSRRPALSRLVTAMDPPNATPSPAAAAGRL